MTSVTRAAEGNRHLTYPHRLGALAVFSELVVGSTEVAVFRMMGSILGSVGPGRHSLSPTGTPFLERAKTTDQRRYDCDLIFVTTQGTRLGLDGSVGTLTDVSGHATEFFLLGTATLATRDPVRVVREGIGFGEPGDGFDRIVVTRLMQGIQRHLGPVLESGRAHPSHLESLGPAVLAAGGATQLEVGVLGLEVVALEISRLTSREGRAPAGNEAAQRRAQVETDASLPDHVSARFGATRIPFMDTDFGMTAHVSVVGYFQGDPIPGHQEQWLKDAIVQTVRGAAASYRGTVLDLAGKKDDWGRYVTSVIAPELAKFTGLRGRVILEAVEIDRGEEGELRRRRAARFGGG